MRRSRRVQRGVAMVEFALVAGLFFLLVTTLLDVGKAIYVKNTLDAAAREGALRAVLLDSPTTSQIEAIINGHSSDVKLDYASPCTYSTTHNAPTTANTGAIYISLRPSGGEGSYTVPAGCTLPSTASNHVAITVTIVYKYQPITPLVGQLLSVGLTFVSTSTMETEY